MDADTLNTTLGVIGILLGLLSAQAQLRAIAKWALKTGGENSRAWVARMQEDADLYVASTSALVSYIVKELLSIVLFAVLAGTAIKLLKGNLIQAPLWISQTATILSAIWIGHKFANIWNIVDLTLRAARKKFPAGNG